MQEYNIAYNKIRRLCRLAESGSFIGHDIDKFERDLLACGLTRKDKLLLGQMLEVVERLAERQFLKRRRDYEENRRILEIQRRRFQ